jgi:hypothetical protein
MRMCAICERTMLMGERAVRFSPGDGAELVDVCPLCLDTALEHGWIKEGTPTTPTIPGERRRRRRGLGEMLGLHRAGADDALMPSEPILRRLGADEVALLEAADLFNASTYRRTVGGIAKSLGAARASIVPLSGVAGELAVTVAWDLSWYQYRVTPESAQPVRLERRGHELEELEGAFREWNAHIEDDGRLVPEIARL